MSKPKWNGGMGAPPPECTMLCKFRMVFFLALSHSSPSHDSVKSAQKPSDQTGTWLLCLLAHIVSCRLPYTTLYTLYKMWSHLHFILAFSLSLLSRPKIR